jgi:hypothetical protein
MDIDIQSEFYRFVGGVIGLMPTRMWARITFI